MIGSKLRSKRVYEKNRGFALIVAVILSAVAAAVTITLTTLAYKNLMLSSTAKESQYAFYAADSALECALFWDNGAHNSFAYTSSPSSISINCEGAAVTLTGTADASTVTYKSGWFTINGTRCARITAYKGSPSTPGTKLYADGVNKSCSEVTTARSVERGLKASY